MRIILNVAAALSPMFVCVCNAVSDREIRACADQGAGSLEDLTAALGVASCCGRCAATARDILADHRSKAHRGEPEASLG